jgi:uncharacterized SAM-binding protein YcdF (DUF218 family)
MYDIVKELALPPGNLWLVLLTAFLLLAFRRRALGFVLFGIGLTAFYLLSIPIVAGRLNAVVQTAPALSEDDVREAGAQAIVVLSGGLHFDSPEYAGATVDETTLERLRYAARLHRLTGLPILVSGGRPREASISLAEAMRVSLSEDFRITDVLLEDRSLDTHENATLSADILRQKGFAKILLVTHASHMPRAVRAFAETGIQVVPAPTVFSHMSSTAAINYVPRLSGMRESHYAIYEALGRVWYALRH